MPREIRINVRTTEEIKERLKVTAKLRGLTESSLVNLLIVRAIREEMAIEPDAFKDALTRSSGVAPRSKHKTPLVRDRSQEGDRRKTG